MSRKPSPQGGYWYASAIRKSDLPGPARHVALTLASVADSASGQVRVSLSVLTGYTGLGRSTVARALNVLEAGDWIERDRPATWEQIQHREMTTYTTTIPAGYPTSTSPALTLDNLSTSPRAGQGPVPETTSTSARAGHRSIDLRARASAGAPAAARTSSEAPHLEVVVPQNLRNAGQPCTCDQAMTAKDDPSECIRCAGRVA